MKDAEEQQLRSQWDRTAIAEVILRERTARDEAMWPEMAQYWHPDATVDVSWFQGGGAEFVARSRAQYEATRKKSDEKSRRNFHDMGAAVVTVAGDRAIAETACTLHSFFPLDGIDCKHSGFVRLFWRAQRLRGEWLIAGLRCLYIRDLLTPCNPNRIPVLDETELATYRASYRFTTYNLVRQGLVPRDDLPGEDRPETVLTLREGERSWLADITICPTPSSVQLTPSAQ